MVQDKHLKVLFNSGYSFCLSCRPLSQHFDDHFCSDQKNTFSYSVPHPSHLPPSPLFHHHIRFLHSFFLLLWRKYLKLIPPKPKLPLSYWYALAQWKFKISFKIYQNFYLCNCILGPTCIYTNNQYILQISISVLLRQQLLK